MSINQQSENALEEATVALFKELGYEHADLMDETFGEYSSHGRSTSSEVIFLPRLRVKLEEINPDLPGEAIDAAIEDITRDRSAMNPTYANQEIHKLLKDGIAVSWKNDNGEEESDRAKIIDWENPANNDFFLAQQMWISGELYNKRCDLVGCINGIPLVFIELKKPAVNVKHAFDDNLKDYQNNTIPQLWWYNAFIILSNGSESKLGSMTAQWEHFVEWKKISDEEEKGIISLDTMIRGTCEKSRLLDLIENFIVFSEVRGGLAKIVAKNHQFLGVRAAVERVHMLASAQETLTPSPSPIGRGEKEGEQNNIQYRGGFDYSGLLERARELRNNQTPAEDVLWELLRDRKFANLKFRRQHQIGNYIADFFCNELNLIVEVDGDIHETAAKSKHDETRDKTLESLGFHVLRLANKIVIYTPEKALAKIANYLPGNPSPDDRKPPSTSGRGNEGEGNTPNDLRRLGVFWHTQGSGKSFSMVFFCQYIQRKITGNWTFLIVTDRRELDDQIYKTFANTGLINEKQCQAESGAHLQQLLKEDHKFVFTLIQKFQTNDDSAYPMLSERSDIIVITDEAHRSQYDTLAMNMRKALPNAAFIGFTGTPLIAGEERTREVFGEYVSIYNFKQSVEDGATVPLYYENRIPELQLINEDLNDDIYDIVEKAELDEEQEKKLERYLGREYHLITRDDRLDTIAKDLVEHFMGRGNLGKAMVISIDRFTAVKMFDKVQQCWQEYLKGLKSRAEKGEKGLDGLIRYMQQTDMAVIISTSQNEQADFAEKGLDILPHRKRIKAEDLETKFKKDDDPLRIVFVCAMWLTGFDVPSCNTLYLDKPMKNHSLMQTIARANRVFPDKNNGLIVDYVGIFRNLQKALAIYGTGSGGGVNEGDNPVENKAELVEMLRSVADTAISFCSDNGVDIQAILASEGFNRIAMIDDAVDKLIYPEDTKKQFMTKVALFIRIHKAVMPDPVAHEFDALRSLLKTILNKLKPENEVDISHVVSEIEELLDVSIASEGYVIEETQSQPQAADKHVPYGKNLYDLSKVDFEALNEHFNKGKKRTVIDKLKSAVEKKLKLMIGLNKTRLDYLEKFTKMVEEYNNGSRNIEEFFGQLTSFVKELDQEEQRGMREGLSEEELVLFDILTRPEMDLTEKEKGDVKKVASQLLGRLKQEKLVLDWRKRQQSRAAVRLCVEEVLDELPRAYDKDIWQTKCENVFQHIFDSYQDAGRNIYEKVG